MFEQSPAQEDRLGLDQSTKSRWKAAPVPSNTCKELQHHKARGTTHLFLHLTHNNLDKVKFMSILLEKNYSIQSKLVILPPPPNQKLALASSIFFLNSSHYAVQSLLCKLTDILVGVDGE